MKTLCQKFCTIREGIYTLTRKWNTSQNSRYENCSSLSWQICIDYFWGTHESLPTDL